MRGHHAPSPAERLLAEIYQAGYSSVDDFIDRLRVRPRNLPRNAGTPVVSVSGGAGASFIDPTADTTELYFGGVDWDSVDPFADTTEFPAIQRVWVIPERHAS
ncbi:hypothetical protein [Nocardia vermiculata]|uniref:Uncharacterized protein n=1 Tax=Nocardia vermiculata TaxID=257274 RepID=A0A846Y4E0_9NOCA|nr:hypothetical protein [Nocardia vermiculata]NKY52138.1 hypothetical protein [Nocardia vermiculata]